MSANINTTCFLDLFQEAVRDRRRPHRVIMFADIVGSTEMKSSGTEVNWLPTVGAFLDYVREGIATCQGSVVKYLGDGVMASFDDDHAAQAINAAILIQERLQKANSEKFLSCNCSIGIATGPIVEYPSPGGEPDYIGTTVDMAARLCAAANAGAIFVDAKTVEAANMVKVISVYGSTRPEGHSYMSREELAPARGFSQGIPYREIIWTQQRFSVKGALVTGLVEEGSGGSGHTQTNINSERQSTVSSSSAGKKLSGRVKSWTADGGGHGWISRADDNWYTDRRYLANGVNDLEQDALVSFVDLPPNRPGGRPRAGCVIPLGMSIKTNFSTIDPVKGFGFIDARDHLGATLGIFVPLGKRAETMTKDKPVSITVSTIEDRGPVGHLDDES
jgi:class 3 adenylate cyclase